MKHKQHPAEVKVSRDDTSKQQLIRSYAEALVACMRAAGCEPEAQPVPSPIILEHLACMSAAVMQLYAIAWITGHIRSQTRKDNTMHFDENTTVYGRMVLDLSRLPLDPQ